MRAAFAISVYPTFVIHHPDAPLQLFGPALPGFLEVRFVIAAFDTVVLRSVRSQEHQLLLIKTRSYLILLPAPLILLSLVFVDRDSHLALGFICNYPVLFFGLHFPVMTGHGFVRSYMGSQCLYGEIGVLAKYSHVVRIGHCGGYSIGDLLFAFSLLLFLLFILFVLFGLSAVREWRYFFIFPVRGLGDFPPAFFLMKKGVNFFKIRGREVSACVNFVIDNNFLGFVSFFISLLVQYFELRHFSTSGCILVLGVGRNVEMLEIILEP